LWGLLSSLDSHRADPDPDPDPYYYYFLSSLEVGGKAGEEKALIVVVSEATTGSFSLSVRCLRYSVATHCRSTVPPALRPPAFGEANCSTLNVPLALPGQETEDTCRHQ